MTPEEAIKTIEVAIADVEWDYPLDYAIAFETAIEALKKQIPKKIMLKADVNFKEAYCCPNCGNFFGYKYDKPIEGIETEYCPDCGQALDWSDTND